MNQRKQKGIQIISEKNIRKITANHYLVESQSQNKTYHVRKLSVSDVWTCECADFHYRLRTQDDKNCKHIWNYSTYYLTSWILQLKKYLMMQKLY